MPPKNTEKPTCYELALGEAIAVGGAGYFKVVTFCGWVHRTEFSGGMAKILVVDDNADERLIYSAVLHYHGHEVDEAGDARQGIELARTRSPSVILMDVHLPVMNGLLAAEILRATPETSEIPILCLSGYDITLTQAKAAGCN